MYRMIVDSSFEDEKSPVLGMSNMLDRNIKNPHNLPFSFFFSTSEGVSHGPRVKPIFDPNKLRISEAGTLKLCDDWEYIPGRRDSHVSSKEIRKMKEFFRDYLVLFLAVWQFEIEDNDLQTYFTGGMSFDEMIHLSDLYNAHDCKEELDKIHDVKSLESFCREKKLLNFYGN